MSLQSRVFRFIYARETFDLIVNRGQFAEASVVAEDLSERERHDD